MSQDTPNTHTQAIITVCFFARLREVLNTERLTMTITAGTTAGDILAQLTERGGVWTELSSGQPVMMAVNQTMARASTELHDQDELALFPPVTGG